jgi:hypothetical protein
VGARVKPLSLVLYRPYSWVVKTAQDPRCPGAVKDWTHPADYLWPPSIHSWRINQCQPLNDLIRGEMDDTAAGGGHGIKYVRAMIEVGLYKLNPADLLLESAWFQPLNLKCSILVSKSAFKCNLCRCIEDDPPAFSKEPKDIGDAFVFASGDKCRGGAEHKLNPVDP